MSSTVFELVGPAGVGKTAILRAISGLAPLVRTGLRIDRMRQFPTISWSLAALTPATLDMLFTDARWLVSGLRHLGRLQVLLNEVTRACASGPQAILLDEGPVFSLGRLSVFHYADTAKGPLARRWRSEVDRWSAILTGVVLLDARNEVLAERIRRRPKAHQIKTGSDREVFAFLDRYRDAYRDIARRLTTQGNVQVLELDTTTTPIEQLATAILTALKGRGVSGAAAEYRGT